MSIPKQAIEAAAKAIADSIGHGMSEKCFDHARDALIAAAPYMSGVKVKQLEWNEWNNERGTPVRWDAEASNFDVFYSIVINHKGYRVVFDYEAVSAIGALDNLEAAKAAAQADYEKRILSALEPFQHSIGWLYDSDDAGTEFSENHPIESGECSDAKDIKPATAENLRSELLISWKAWAEDREELNKLRDAPSSAREQVLDEVFQILQQYSEHPNEVVSFVMVELWDAIRALK